jgi:hypothetical protein
VREGLGQPITWPRSAFLSTARVERRLTAILAADVRARRCAFPERGLARIRNCACWPRAVRPSVCQRACGSLLWRRSRSTAANPAKCCTALSNWCPVRIWRYSHAMTDGPNGEMSAARPVTLAARSKHPVADISRINSWISDVTLQGLADMPSPPSICRPISAMAR